LGEGVKQVWICEASNRNQVSIWPIAALALREMVSVVVSSI